MSEDPQAYNPRNKQRRDGNSVSFDLTGDTRKQFDMVKAAMRRVMPSINPNNAEVARHAIMIASEMSDEWVRQHIARLDKEANAAQAGDGGDG